ncbi:MAG: DMT family transporter [Hyphomicrobiaceae bacterium]
MEQYRSSADRTLDLNRSRLGGNIFYLGLLLLLILTWAVSWPVIKVGVGEVPPIWFGVLRYAIATACVFALVLMTGGLQVPPRQDWSLILVSGALQMAAYSALTGIALVSLPPGRASVLAFSTPIWVVPLAAWWLGERVPVRSAAGAVIGLIGVAAIASPSLVLQETTSLLAYACLMGASAAWALSIVYVRSHCFTASAFTLAPWQMLVSTVLLLPIAIAAEGPPPAIGMTGAMSLAFVGPVSTGFAYWAVVEACRHFRASTMSMALLATPSLGILISAITLGERIDGLLIAGVAMVALGIWLATVMGAKCEHAPRSRTEPARSSVKP